LGKYYVYVLSIPLVVIINNNKTMHNIMFAHVYSPFGAVCAIPPLRLPARLGCTSLASVPPSWRATSRPHLRNRSLVRWLYHVGRITPHDFADDLRDPICDVNVVARTNRVSGDGPLSSGGGVGVGNVVEVVRGRGGNRMWAAGCDGHVCISNLKPWEAL
jgi:hypothetical protein